MNRTTNAAGLHVSVIIPHRDSPEALARCLDSLERQPVDFDYEIIVVDGSHEPPSWAARRPRVRMLSEPAPGPGPARNKGAAAARAPILAFIDADCRVAPDWLQAVRTGFDRRPAVDVLAGRVQVTPLDGRGWTPCGVFESVFAYQQERNVRRANVAATANLAMRATAMATVGGFSGADFLEDWEWCRRAAAAGLTLEYDGDMLVRHDARDTFPLLAGKWRRHVHQEFMSHRKAGGGGLSFALKALAVVAATPAVTLYLLTRPQHAFAQRLRVVPTLWRVRLLRATEMLRSLLEPGRARPPWNG